MKLPKSSKQPKKPSDPHPWPFVLRKVNGHSMMPILPPSTFVVGSRWFRKLRVGNVVIFLHETKEKIKRIERIEDDGSLFLIGEHPEASTDSRHFGSIDRCWVIAKVILPSVKPRD